MAKSKSNRFVPMFFEIAPREATVGGHHVRLRSVNTNVIMHSEHYCGSVSHGLRSVQNIVDGLNVPTVTCVVLKREHLYDKYPVARLFEFRAGQHYTELFAPDEKSLAKMLSFRRRAIPRPVYQPLDKLPIN